MKQVNIKKVLIPNIPYFVIGLYASKLGEAWRLAEGADASGKLLHIMDGLAAALQSPLPSFQPTDLLIGLLCGVALRMAVYLKGKNAKKYRHGAEYGTARWGTAADIQPYMDPVFENNVILTQTESLTMNNRPKDPKTARNKNVLIIGGSGSGKTRFWLKPNLMQCTSKTYPVSFVVTDPKGTIVLECGKLLWRNGYRIKILNTINFKKSHHYNPFSYIHSEKDILKLVTALIANTSNGQKGGDEFWTKAETLLYTALIGYLHYEAPEEEQNFATLVTLINSMEVREDDEEFKNPVDLMFEELAQQKPDHFAVRQYAKYRLAAGKTAKSILVSCGARLAPFDIAELREVTAYDELGLDTLGDAKTALFLIMSDTDDTFNFLISLCYTQLFNLLCEKADDVYGGRLPVHVRCLIDEAANIGQIPKLEKLVATIRSREISACLVLQAQSQLKAIYKDNCDTIIGNMDTKIFLGGSEPTTLKELSSSLGKETIDTYNTGESRGRETSHSLNYQKLGKALMDIDELAVLDGGKCILQLRGVRPFLSSKYDITRHPNYKYLADFDKKNTFDIERFLSTQLKPKPSEVYDVFEVDVSEVDIADDPDGEAE
ncbi:MAG: type IV secretory system conjugative DNA transfer family protein [Oscillospiraceae bacterium]|nr:type IV secretory system conjugative DNA transfer family protein [Oscillospiraceae bacterium]